MQAFILVGARQDEKLGRVVENLYTGLDGVALQKAADEAAASGKFTLIGKITNPACTPMPISATPTRGTTPQFPRAKAAKIETRLQPTPRHIQQQQSAEALLRAERLKITTQGDQKPGEGASKLNENGPTFEEYVKAGYKPESYPPQGFAEKDSEGLKAFRAEQAAKKQADEEAAKKAAEQQASSAPTVPASGESQAPESREPLAPEAEAPKTEAPAKAPQAGKQTKNK